MQKWIDFKNKRSKCIWILLDLKNKSKACENTAKKAAWWLRYLTLWKIYLMVKDGFFQKNQLGIGLLGRKWPEIGEKLVSISCFKNLKQNKAWYISHFGSKTVQSSGRATSFKSEGREFEPHSSKFLFVFTFQLIHIFVTWRNNFE